jgi:riboflavin synthase
MFTGIVTDLGCVRSLSHDGDTRIAFDTAYDTASIANGASICCSGVCLTVIDRGSDRGSNWFAVTASAETLSKTTLGGWKPGTPVNFERPLKVGDELGGHIVTGHVDGIATARSVTADGQSWRFVFQAPPTLSRFIASKGSVALDGVSLTVNEVDGDLFGVNIIPHTFGVTTFGSLRAGDPVNLEIDILARYVARLQEQARL